MGWQYIQWWSNRSTQLSHVRQWLARGGRKILHVAAQAMAPYDRGQSNEIQQRRALIGLGSIRQYFNCVGAPSTITVSVRVRLEYRRTGGAAAAVAPDEPSDPTSAFYASDSGVSMMTGCHRSTHRRRRVYQTRAGVHQAAAVEAWSTRQARRPPRVSHSLHRHDRSSCWLVPRASSWPSASAREARGPRDRCATSEARCPGRRMPQQASCSACRPPAAPRARRLPPIHRSKPNSHCSERSEAVRLACRRSMGELATVHEDQIDRERQDDQSDCRMEQLAIGTRDRSTATIESVLDSWGGWLESTRGVASETHTLMQQQL